MTTLLVMFVGSGALMAGLGIPLILQKIPPNPFYGVRVARALHNPAVWYPANAYAGRRFLVLGIGIVLAAVVLFAIPGMDVLGYSFTSGAISLVGIAVVVAQSLLYVQSFPEQGAP